MEVIVISSKCNLIKLKIARLVLSNNHSIIKSRLHPKKNRLCTGGWMLIFFLHVIKNLPHNFIPVTVFISIHIQYVHFLISPFVCFISCLYHTVQLNACTVHIAWVILLEMYHRHRMYKQIVLAALFHFSCHSKKLNCILHVLYLSSQIELTAYIFPIHGSLPGI
jgi:hypothetical protein